MQIRSQQNNAQSCEGWPGDCFVGLPPTGLYAASNLAAVPPHDSNTFNSSCRQVQLAGALSCMST